MTGADGGGKTTVFILGASADIGREMALRYHADGWRVVGAYRDESHVAPLRELPDVTLIQCDLAGAAAVESLKEALGGEFRWDLFVSSVGTMAPIGPFFEIDFDDWERSVSVNVLAQLRVLHALYPYRRPGGQSHACFLAGGGTNGPLTNYSAYCLSKIALIKMCELLDDETTDLNVYIIGPGYMRTKIREETFAAGDRAGPGLEKTQAFYETEGTSFDDLYAHIGWCMAQGRQVAGGRNFSTMYDPWRAGGAALARRLPGNSDDYRLRRHDSES